MSGFCESLLQLGDWLHNNGIDRRDVEIQIVPRDSKTKWAVGQAIDRELGEVIGRFSCDRHTYGRVGDMPFRLGEHSHAMEELRKYLRTTEEVAEMAREAGKTEVKHRVQRALEGA